MASENVRKGKAKVNTNTSLNSFANDGSFLELYKQKSKEQENAADQQKDVTAEADTEKRKTTNILLQV